MNKKGFSVKIFLAILLILILISLGVVVYFFPDFSDKWILGTNFGGPLQNFLALIGAPTSFLGFFGRIIFLLLTGFVAGFFYFLIVASYVRLVHGEYRIYAGESWIDKYVSVLQRWSSNVLAGALILSVIYTYLFMIPILNRIFEFLTFAWVGGFVGWVVELIVRGIPLVESYAPFYLEILTRALVLVLVLLLITFIPIIIYWISHYSISIIVSLINPSENSFFGRIKKARREAKAKETRQYAKIGLKTLTETGRTAMGEQKKPKGILGNIWKIIFGS